jgi:hypothetical protein
MGTVEYRALEAQVRGRGVDPRPHLAMLRKMLREAYELQAIKLKPQFPPLPPKPRKLPAAPLEVVRATLAASTRVAADGNRPRLLREPTERRGSGGARDRRRL